MDKQVKWSTVHMQQDSMYIRDVSCRGEFPKKMDNKEAPPPRVSGTDLK